MAPFLHPALESLNTLLCTGPEGVYESCLNATCAVASLSEKAFIPFYPSFMHSFKAVLVARTGSLILASSLWAVWLSTRFQDC